MKYNLYIRLAQLVAIVHMMMYVQLGWSYATEGYGLHPAVCAAVIVAGTLLIQFGIIRNVRILRDRV